MCKFFLEVQNNMNSFKIHGQSVLVDKLSGIVSSGRIAHAYLFTGPEGIGKRTIADWFAQTILCTGQTDKPCGVCHSCIQYQSGNHPDVVYVEPEGNKIKVDSIRDNVITAAHVKPYQSRYKIFMIDDAHTMNVNAQNALLKTLEEPPDFVIIMMMSDNDNSMLQTVLSRCQRIPIPPLSDSEICQIIKENVEISEEDAFVYAKLSEGIPGRGIKLAGSSDFRNLRNGVLDIMVKMFNIPMWEVFEHTSFFIENKEDMGTILDILLLWLRDIMVYKETGDDRLILNMDKISSIRQEAKLFTINGIQCMIEEVEKTKKMLDSNTNYQLTIENLLMAFRREKGQYA
jgi:DNA polymerase III subunit delta'